MRVHFSTLTVEQIFYLNITVAMFYYDDDDSPNQHGNVPFKSLSIRKTRHARLSSLLLTFEGNADGFCCILVLWLPLYSVFDATAEKAHSRNVQNYMTPFNEVDKLETVHTEHLYLTVALSLATDGVLTCLYPLHHPLLTMDASVQVTFIGLLEAKLLNEMDYGI